MYMMCFLFFYKCNLIFFLFTFIYGWRLLFIPRQSSFVNLHPLYAFHEWIPLSPRIAHSDAEKAVECISFFNIFFLHFTHRPLHTVELTFFPRYIWLESEWVADGVSGVSVITCIHTKHNYLNEICSRIQYPLRYSAYYSIWSKCLWHAPYKVQ